jgi:hypothetical protein
VTFAAAALALALASGEAAPSPEAAPPAAAQSRPTPLVPLRVEAAADGSPIAFREGDAAPIRGVDIYRAVLRLDLVERHDRARIAKRALLVGSAVALVGGPALGYALGSAAARPTVNCWILGEDGQPIPECRPNADIERENDRKLRRGVLVGTGVGVGLAAVFLVAGLSIQPPVPDLEEARSLAARFNARLESPAAPPRAQLRLEPVDGGAWMGIAGRF